MSILLSMHENVNSLIVQIINLKYALILRWVRIPSQVV